MVKNIIKYKNKKNSNNIFSKRTLIIISIIIVLGGVIGLILYFAVFKNKHSGGGGGGGNIPIPPKPKGKIIGAWSSLIGCGSDYFNIISLASALPQEYNPSSYTKFFENYVKGDYNSNLSSGNTKYIISIGGSNATSTGWTLMFNSLSDPSNNYINLQNFISACKCRGIVGIDLDLEQEPNNYTSNNHKSLETDKYIKNNVSIIDTINNIMTQIKIFEPNFIIMLTILLGEPKNFAGLLNNPNYDYLTLMLYNGGMYQADLTGAGCDWDQWAELILSKGETGCKTPLKENPPSAVTYPKDANLSAIIPSKVLLGLIIDTIPSQPSNIALNASIVARAGQLINQYGGGGQMIWAIPGFNQNCVSSLNDLGYNFDESKCAQSGCSKSDTPCILNSNDICVATSCGSKQMNVTDADCAPCSLTQITWPCDSAYYEGLCEVKGVTKPTCL